MIGYQVSEHDKVLMKVEGPGFGNDLGSAFAARDYHPWPNHQDNHSATWYLVSELVKR